MFTKRVIHLPNWQRHNSFQNGFGSFVRLAADKAFDATVDSVLTSKKQSSLIIAAAGSGKTRLLIETLTRRIMQGLTDPAHDKVIVFTFTNNAADELVVRLSTALEHQGRGDVINRIFIGTIHGWCNSYLQDSGVLANTKVVDELEQAQIIQRVFPLLHLDSLYQGKNQYSKIDRFLSALEFFYNESLEIGDRVIPDNVRSAIEGYLTFMRSQRLLDFGSLIRESVARIREEKEKAPRLDIYVDEFQDVNPAQVSLLKVMLAANGESRLIAVADPRQSIYQWRGSDVNRTLTFSKDFEDSEVGEIIVNHRSRPGIVNYANLVAREMSFSKTFKVTDMSPSDERSDSLDSVILDDTTVPNEGAVVSTIKDLLARGVKPGEIAVLLRSVVNHGKQLMDDLDREEIKYYSPNRNSGTAFVEEFMLSIIDLIEKMAEPQNPANIEDEREFREKVQEDVNKISNFCNVKDPERIKSYVADWLKELTRDGARPMNERYNFRQQLFVFCESAGLRIDPSDSIVQEGFSAVAQVMRAIEVAYRR